MRKAKKKSQKYADWNRFVNIGIFVLMLNPLGYHRWNNFKAISYVRPLKVVLFSNCIYNKKMLVVIKIAIEKKNKDSCGFFRFFR